MLLLFTREGEEYHHQKGKWRHKPYGTFAIKLCNALLEEDLTTLKEMTEETEESIITSLTWPVLNLSLGVATGATASKITEIAGMLYTETARKRASKTFGDIYRYLRGEDKTLWEIWRQIHPYPYAEENRIGWYVEAATEFEAAAAEVVLAFMHEWKRRFRVCRKCLLFHITGGCPRCKKQKKDKDRFLNLLRVHKHRAKHGTAAFGSLPEDNRKEVQEMIAEISNRVNKEGLSVGVVLEYKEFLQGLPWPGGIKPPVEGVEKLLKEIFGRKEGNGSKK